MMRCVPKINRIYWLSLMLASVFGANAGDFLSDVVDLGHLDGTPYLAVCLAIVFVAARVLPAAGALLFWAAIIIIRASATNVGDAFRDFGIGFDLSLPLCVVLLALSLVVWRLARPPEADTGFVPVNAFYWVSMFFAGVLGTVVGDAMSYAVGLGNFGAMVCLGAPLAVVLFAGRNGLLTQLSYYWFTVSLIRSAGTAAGDLLAHRFFGIAGSTALSGAVFVGLVALAYGLTRTNIRVADERVCVEAPS